MFSILEQNILRLKLIPLIGNKTILSIISKYHEAQKKILDLKSLDTELLSESQRKNVNEFSSKLDDLLAKLEKYILENNIKVVNIFDPEFPESLKNIANPPVVLFLKGDISYNYNLSIAVVGTRKFTSYGRDSCVRFCHALAQNQFTVISGLAAGIDSIAHEAVLDMNGKCIGVLGGGFKYTYPRSNVHLYKKILEKGGALVTEYLPEDRPLKSFFPARNRIIAGLSRGTLVVEAAHQSGSLITARFAFEQGKEVFAIPADVNRLNSQGCNELIKQNIAKLVTDPSDILEEYGFSLSHNSSNPHNSVPTNLDKKAKTVFEIITKGACLVDDICAQSGLDITETMEILTTLELQGLVCRNEDDNWICLSRF